MAKTANNKKKILKAPVSKDERIKLLLGLFAVFFTIYLLFGFISYLFTWKADQSKLDISAFKLIFDSTIEIENWAGKLGGILSHVFIHNWFGLASFGFLLIFATLGFRLLGFRFLPIRKTFKYVIIYTIWVSIAFGYLFHNSDFLPGGAHGYFLSSWFNAFVGKIGTAFLLLISLFAILAFSFNSFIDIVKKAIKLDFTLAFPERKNTETQDIAAENNQHIENNPTEKTNTDNSDNNNNDEFSDDSFTFKVYGNESETENTDHNYEPEQDDYDNLNAFDNLETVEVKVVEHQTKNNNSEQAYTAKQYSVSDNSNANEQHNNSDFGFEVEIKENEEDEEFFESMPVGDYDPTLDLSNYKMPDINFLADHDAGNTSVSNDELKANKDKIVETLAHYKIEIVDIKAIVGPTITLYEIVPAPGIRISKIKGLESDIALSLAALGIRIIAPIPGKNAVGIEVPNLKPKVVSMRSIIASAKFQNSKYELPLALGKTISNETFVLDLAKAPHLLVAGATGQGKSVGLNAILTSLLYKKHPAQLKMVLVDPKKVELTLYQKIEKHYLAMLPDAEESIITDTQKVVNTLNSLCVEMDSRYDLLKAAHCRNIKEYNAKFISRNLNPTKGHKFLPYIVVVIDEFADLIMTAGKEVELPIARLAQLARAIGIHLIIATQRPTTNIITGLIKANFPARIAFRVTSMMDSRTILDSPGANQLIGRGDMLISQGSDVVRLQCAFVDTPEIEEIVKHIEQQQSYPSAYYLPEYSGDESGDPIDVDLSKKDAMFDDAARLVVMNQQGSTSMIQRKFSIGYNRAGRIMDQLEAAGVVGPFEGSKARQVLLPDEYSLEQLLNNMNNGNS